LLVAAGFIFNIEAFALFTHHRVPVDRPQAVAELLAR
jgi:hypothetical protein